MPGVLLFLSAPQAHIGALVAGVLLCRLAHKVLKGAPWVGSYSVVRCTRRLMGQTLLFSCLCWREGERGCGYMSLSSILLSWLPGFPPQGFPTTISSLTPFIHLSAVNGSLCLGIVLQSLNSSSQLLCLPGDLCPCPGYLWRQQGLSNSHSTGCHMDRLLQSQP